MFPGIVLSCHICSRSFLPSIFEYWKHNVLVLFAHLVPDSDRAMAFLLAWNSWWMYLHHEHWHTLQIMMFAAAAVIVGIQADAYLPVGIVLQYKSPRWGRRLGNCCRLNVLCPPRFLYLSTWAPVGVLFRDTVESQANAALLAEMDHHCGPWSLYWLLVLAPAHCFLVGLNFILIGDNLLSNSYGSENWWCQVRSRDCDLWSHIAWIGILFLTPVS